MSELTNHRGWCEHRRKVYSGEAQMMLQPRYFLVQPDLGPLTVQRLQEIDEAIFGAGLLGGSGESVIVTYEEESKP